MTLQECYSKLEGDYDEVMSRLRREELVAKFVIKFLDDKSFADLCRGMEEHNRENAFRAAHTIKGVCQNLSFTKLYKTSHELTESLRNDWGSEAEDLFEATKLNYEQVCRAIREFANV